MNMSVSDHDYINFSQDDELNYILKKYHKSQAHENRVELKKLGQAYKNETKSKRLKHVEFYPYLEKHLDKLR